MRNESGKKLTKSEFKELYLSYYPIIFKVAVYIFKEESLAEDTVQEVFLKIWRDQSILYEVKNLKAYLITMTRNHSFDELKKRRNEETRILQLENELINIEESEDEAFRKALEIAVSKLPPKCRLIFSLSRFEGLSNDEISEYLKISKRTVETQISMALKAFRGDLKPIFESYLPEYMLVSVVSLLQLV